MPAGDERRQQDEARQTRQARSATSGVVRTNAMTAGSAQGVGDDAACSEFKDDRIGVEVGDHAVAAEVGGEWAQTSVIREMTAARRQARGRNRQIANSA